jgi:hypothetical protein
MQLLETAISEGRSPFRGHGGALNRQEYDSKGAHSRGQSVNEPIRAVYVSGHGFSRAVSSTMHPGF